MPKGHPNSWSGKIRVQEPGTVTPHGPVAHEVKKGDPRVDGPYLDDVNEARANARREARMKFFAEQEAEQEGDENGPGE